MLRKEFRLAVKFVGIHFFIFLLLKCAPMDTK